MSGVPFQVSQVSTTFIMSLSPGRQEDVGAGRGRKGDFYVKCAQNKLYYHTEHVFGVPKHQRPLLGAALRRRNGPGQSCKLVDNATTSQTHSFDACVPHTIQNAQSSCTLARISARTHQIRPGSWAGSTEVRAGEQSRPKRKWQRTCRNTRTTNERKQPKA